MEDQNPTILWNLYERANFADGLISDLEDMLDTLNTAHAIAPDHADAGLVAKIVRDISIHLGDLRDQRRELSGMMRLLHSKEG